VGCALRCGERRSKLCRELLYGKLGVGDRERIALGWVEAFRVGVTAEGEHADKRGPNCDTWGPQQPD